MDDFFTLASFATMSGCVLAVVALMNTIRSVFNWGPKWLGLLISLVISLIAYQLTSKIGQSATSSEWYQYPIVIVNGCLLYTSAFGIQNAIIAKTPSIEQLSHNSWKNKISGLNFRTKW